jgi:hypothetical protein
MKLNFELDLEAPGRPASRSLTEGGSLRRNYHSLYAIFEVWMGDEIVSIFPCILVTAELASKFSSLGQTGYILKDVAVEKDHSMDLRQPGRQLPPFVWFKVTGSPDRDDFF